MVEVLAASSVDESTLILNAATFDLYSVVEKLDYEEFIDQVKAIFTDIK